MDVNRDRKRTVSATEETAAREYRSLIEYLPAVIYTAEPGVERRWLYVSPQSKTILGFTYDELRADPLLFYQHIHPEDRPRLIAEEARSLTSETSLILEFRFFKRDGSLIWLREKSLLMRDPVSGRRYFQGFMFDISEPKRTEEQLRESEERFRAAFDNAPYGMALSDLDGRYLEVNDAFCRMIGYARDELVGRDYKSVTHPDDIEGNESQRRASLTDPAVPIDLVTKRYLHKDGRVIWVQGSVSLIHDSEGRPTYFVAQAQDITAQREAEESREVLEAQLLQSQKMEAIGRLAGGIAHDFNNILAVIINCAGFLKDELGPGDPKIEDVEEIRRAGVRATKLVRQLLAFSRKETVNPEVLDVSDVVDGVKDLLQRTIGEDVELLFTPCPRPCRTEIDQSQLERVLVNLAVNARDAMPDGGTLTIATSGVTVTRSLASAAPGLEPGRYVSLTVSDTGCGMSPDIADRVFEPFFTTKPRGEGTGLGLATVYGIVTQANGSVILHTKEGEGTSFEIFLPFARDRVPPNPATSVDPTEDGKGETVLLVEDEAPVRELVCRILEKDGYEVISVASPSEALHVSRTRLKDIDLLLTDVVMPKMSGKTLADRLTGARPGLQVIFMSGYDDDIVSRRGVGEDADNFIQKPFTSEELVAAVRSVLPARVD